MVFAAALNDLFRDPEMAIDATYTAADGVPRRVRAIREQPETSGPFGQVGFKLSPASQSTALQLIIQRSDVAVASRGDAVTVNGLTYPVREADLADTGGLTWRLGLGPPA